GHRRRLHVPAANSIHQFGPSGAASILYGAVRREQAMSPKHRSLTVAAPKPAASARESTFRSRDRKGAVLRRGQAAFEFALLYSAVILPLTFMIVFVAEMIWTWHSVVDFTRAGAQFAATHC